MRLIYDAPWGGMYITQTRAFTTIYVSVRLVDYTHRNNDYNVLSDALNKQYGPVL